MGVDLDNYRNYICRWCNERTPFGSEYCSAKCREMHKKFIKATFGQYLKKMATEIPTDEK